MVFKVIMKFSDGLTEELDEVFDSEDDAISHGEIQASNYSQGRDVLHLSNPGDYPLEDDDVDFEVVERHD